MVEFAIVTGLIFIPVVFGIIEFGRAVFAKSMVTAAAREGVRYAIVRGDAYATLMGGSIADSTSVANYVKARTPLTGIIVRPTWRHGGDLGDTVTVRVTFTHRPIVKVPGLLTTKTLSSSSSQLVVF